MMANLPENSFWEPGIYQIENTDPVSGGIPNLAQGVGINNAAAQQLANRTTWLKGRLDTLLNGADPALDTLAELAAALGNDDDLAATIAAQLAAAREQAIRDAYPIGRPIKTYHDLPSVPADVVTLELNRAEISRATYADLWALVQTSGRYDATGASTAAYGPGDGASTFQLFDARGEFERGLDNGRGVDLGRTLESGQLDEFKSHDHRIQSYTIRDGDDASGGSSLVEADSGGGGSYQGYSAVFMENTGGVETRPRNIAVKYFIVAAYNFGA